MGFADLIKKTCETTPIHGTAYFVNKQLHFIEKLFWLIILLSASFFSFNICLKQWQRYRDSPVVYSMELTWNKRDFRYSAITMCTNYYSKENTAKLIQRIWGHEPNTTKFEYYAKFLEKINLMRYNKMHELKPYTNDSTLEKIDFLNILLSMREGELPEETYTKNTEVKSDLTEEEKYQQFRSNYKEPNVYAAAMTEVGMCQTTSQHSEYTNPYGKIKHLPVTKIVYCDIMKECGILITPNISPNFNITIYLHDAFDVVSPNDRSTVKREILPKSSLIVEVLLSCTTAEEEVRNLPIAYRKCRYPDENNLKYFKIYRPGLCRLECRINAALDLCNCKPYFYTVAPHIPICDIKGMLCLVTKNWTQTDCRAKCVPLCEEYTYTGTQNTQFNDISASYDRSISIQLLRQKMNIQRRVIFSTDQLIVSLGGAIGLFLGSSFLSLFQIIFCICEFINSNVAAYLKRKRAQNRIEVKMVEPKVTLKD